MGAHDISPIRTRLIQETKCLSYPRPVSPSVATICLPGKRSFSCCCLSTNGGRGCTHYHAWPQPYDHRPSHPHNAGTEHVGFSPARQTSLAPIKPCGWAGGRGRDACDDGYCCTFVVQKANKDKTSDEFSWKNKKKRRLKKKKKKKKPGGDGAATLNKELTPRGSMAVKPSFGSSCLASSDEKGPCA